MMIYHFKIAAAAVAVGVNSVQGQRGRRSFNQFPVMEPGLRTERKLEVDCASNENICDFEDNGDPKYAVCTSSGDTKCVPGPTYVGQSVSDGKGGSYSISSCSCCSGDLEPFCGNLGSVPSCEFGDFSCDPEYEDKVLFCYKDISKSGKKFEEKQVCENPFTYPKYENGDVFVGCGENCMTGTYPSESPSDAPSETPTDTCLLCEEEPEFVFSPLTATYVQHQFYASQLGCTLATVQTSEDQASLTDYIRSLDPLVLGCGTNSTSDCVAYLGAQLVGAQADCTSFAWVDGDEFDASLPPYNNFWSSSEPNCITLYEALGVNLEEPPVAGWLSLSSKTPAAALYKCCGELNVVLTKGPEYANCVVPPEVPSRTCVDPPPFDFEVYTVNENSNCDGQVPVGTVCSTENTCPDGYGSPPEGVTGGFTCVATGAESAEWVGSISGCLLLCSDFSLHIATDDYGDETYWSLQLEGQEVLGITSGTLSSNTEYQFDLVCPNEEDCYELLIYDSAGDGICCEWGAGSYTIEYKGTQFLGNGDFGSSASYFTPPCDVGRRLEPGTSELTVHPHLHANTEVLFGEENIVEITISVPTEQDVQVTIWNVLHEEEFVVSLFAGMIAPEAPVKVTFDTEDIHTLNYKAKISGAIGFETIELLLAKIEDPGSRR